MDASKSLNYKVFFRHKNSIGYFLVRYFSIIKAANINSDYWLIIDYWLPFFGDCKFKYGQMDFKPVKGV